MHSGRNGGWDWTASVRSEPRQVLRNAHSVSVSLGVRAVSRRSSAFSDSLRGRVPERLLWANGVVPRDTVERCALRVLAFLSRSGSSGQRGPIALGYRLRERGLLRVGMIAHGAPDRDIGEAPGPADRQAPHPAKAERHRRLPQAIIERHLECIEGRFVAQRQSTASIR